MKTSPSDSVITEVFVRDQHAARFDYDVKAISETFKPDKRLPAASTSATPLAA